MLNPDPRQGPSPSVWTASLFINLHPPDYLLPDSLSPGCTHLLCAHLSTHSTSIVRASSRPCNHSTNTRINKVCSLPLKEDKEVIKIQSGKISICKVPRNWLSGQSGPLLAFYFVLTKLRSGFSPSYMSLNSVCPQIWASTEKWNMSPYLLPPVIGWPQEDTLLSDLTGHLPFACPNFPLKISIKLLLIPLYPVKEKTFSPLIFSCLQISEIRAFSITMVFLLNKVSPYPCLGLFLFGSTQRREP